MNGIPPPSMSPIRPAAKISPSSLKLPLPFSLSPVPESVSASLLAAAGGDVLHESVGELTVALEVTHVQDGHAPERGDGGEDG